ncbi:hypothetical protein [Croceicoccus sp. BE223]|uniref:hypothetical protein n=1 Tax=Croceicoccus sp. BE223 TaxID=2817716 RepID=UPI0028599BD2|nr:hypothetical protein [Croceicoccus sp. BE223]MDR7101442.1 hypothetical protein [Croceicoccus sp. BE223]
MPDSVKPVADSARRVRFEEMTAGAELDRLRRVQFQRPLRWNEIERVHHLLDLTARRQQRLARERALRALQVAL